MASSTPDLQTATEKADKRRWNAFVCQDCRGIFRIPADYSGKGVVCPCCDRMLRIPRAGETVPGLMQSLDENEISQSPQESTPIDEPEPIEKNETSKQESRPAFPAQAPGGQLRRRKKHRDRSIDTENDWQQNRGRKMRFSHRIQMIWWAGAAILGTSIAVTVMVALLKKPPHDTAATTPPFANATVIFPIADKTQPDAEAAVHLAQLNEGYAVIEKFFAAENIESMMPLLRPVAGLEEKVRQYYQSKPVALKDHQGIEKSTTRFAAGHRMMQSEIRMHDQSTRTITLIKVGDSYRVDWESWVGWSEMDSATLTRIKPTKLTEVRVNVEMVPYYNYDFPNSSESHWQSYRLTFAYSDDFVYGYIERSSPVNDMVRLASDQTSRPMILRIRFRDTTSHPSQVLIDSVVSDSWVAEVPEE